MSFVKSITPNSKVLLLAADNVLASQQYNGDLVFLAEEKFGDIASLKDSSFNIVASVMELPYSPPFYAHILRVLSPGGLFVVQTTESSSRDVSKSLVFSGFTDMEKLDNGTVLTCRRPGWNLGAAAPLSLSASLNSKPTQSAPPAKKWTLAADDLNEDDLDLEDENQLLQREKEKVQVAPKITSEMDCGTGGDGKRKACKNCSCGLAEVIEAEAQGGAKKAAPVSSCGSCGLGDAFRCSTCPYLGQPAFQQTNTGSVKLQL
jgi:RNase P subunit RPR2